MRYNRAVLRSSGCLMAVVIATNANAQTIASAGPVAGAGGSASQVAQAGTTPDQQPSATRGAVSSPRVEEGLADIVVTAERRATNVQRTPLAITVLSGEAIAKSGISDSRALLNSVPGLSISQTSANTNLGVRGLASGGGNAFTDPAVSFNVNGVTFGRPFSAVAPFYDISRVEVLKGPQGTLYGRNATVGAINVVPNRPTHNFEGAASIALGSYHQFDTTGMINLPIDDKLAARAAFQTVKHSGYLNNGLNDAKSEAARLGISYEASSALNFYVSADYFHDGSKGAGTIYLYPKGFAGSRYQNPDDPWETLVSPPCGTPALCPTFGDSGLSPAAVPAIASLPVIGQDAYVNNSTLLFMGEMNWDVGPATLTVVPAHVRTRVDFVNYGQGFRQRQDFHIGQDTLEARLASNGNSRLRWLLGGYYFTEETKGYSAFSNPRYYADITIQSLTDKNYAFFGQATYSLTNWFRATGGLRYTHERKTVRGYGNGAPADSNPLTAECNAASLAAGAVELGVTPLSPVGACRFPTAGDKTFTDKSFRVGLELDLGPKSLLYANISSAFKAGGFYAGLAPNTYLPEKLTSYQIGSKNKFFDNRLLLNLEAFYWDYKDQQISVFRTLNPPQLTAPVPVNVPGNVKGAEVETSLLVTKNDLFTGTLLYAKGKYDIFPTSVSPNGTIGGLIDAPRINLPKWSGTVGYQRSFHLGERGTLMFNGQMHFESSTWLNVNHIPGSYRPAFHVVDAALTYSSPDDRWTLSGFVKNIGNVPVLYAGTSGGVTPGLTYRPRTNTAAPYAAIGAPRTYGARLSARF